MIKPVASLAMVLALKVASSTGAAMAQGPSGPSTFCSDVEMQAARLRSALDDLESTSVVKRIVASHTLKGVIGCGSELAGPALLALEASIVSMPFQQEQPAWKLERRSALRALAVRSTERDFPFDLRRMNFSGVSLPLAVLNSSTLYSADFSGADLYGATFQGSRLHSVSLIGANISGANFSDARLSGAKFCSGTNTAAPELTALSPILRTAGSGAFFYNICGQALTFRGANLAGTFFDDSNLSHVDFRDAILYEAKFRNATLLNARFDRSELKGSAFHPHLYDLARPEDRASLLKFPEDKSHTAAHVADSSFAGADLSKANFSLSVITSTSFDRAKLKDAVFIRSKLRGSTFHGASLEGADFTDADVDLASLQEGYLCNTVLPSGFIEDVGDRRCPLAQELEIPTPDPYIPPSNAHDCELLRTPNISPFRECSLRSLPIFEQIFKIAQ